MEQIKDQYKNLGDQAATIINSNVIERRQFNVPITETDLENSVIESIWKTFDGFRPQIAKHLNVSELDLVILDARIVGVKIDGHRVINPVGFTGRKIDIAVLMTVSAKGINAVKYADSSDELFGGFHESASISAYMIADREKTDGMVYVEIGDDRSRVCIADKGRSDCPLRVDWGRRDIISAISGVFMSNSEMGEMIYKRFLGGEASAAVTDKIAQSFFDSLKSFLSDLSGTDRVSELFGRDGALPVFIRTTEDFPLPETAGKRYFAFGSKRVKISIDSGSGPSDFLRDKNNQYRALNEAAGKSIKWIRA